jgi:hypothetical protein
VGRSCPSGVQQDAVRNDVERYGLVAVGRSCRNQSCDHRYKLRCRFRTGRGWPSSGEAVRLANRPRPPSRSPPGSPRSHKKRACGGQRRDTTRTPTALCRRPPGPLPGPSAPTRSLQRPRNVRVVTRARSLLDVLAHTVPPLREILDSSVLMRLAWAPLRSRSAALRDPLASARGVIVAQWPIRLR